MHTLLKAARAIDAVNERIGRWVYWLVLLMVLESAGNAIVRKLFNSSSNALLELQWYLFSAVFLLCAGWTLLRNEHVRIDILQGRLSPRGQAWLDIFGAVFFLLPMVFIFIWLSWPWFLRTYTEGEDLGQRRRPGPLARAAARAGGLHAARAAGALRDRQARRVPRRRGAGPGEAPRRARRGEGARGGDPQDGRGKS